jgi:hypothetical protein
MPFLASGQLKATASGLKASAELENLTGIIGSANKILVTVSFLGLYFIALMVIGNLLPYILKAYSRLGKRSK